MERKALLEQTGRVVQKYKKKEEDLAVQSCVDSFGEMNRVVGGVSGVVLRGAVADFAHGCRCCFKNAAFEI